MYACHNIPGTAQACHIPYCLNGEGFTPEKTHENETPRHACIHVALNSNTELHNGAAGGYIAKVVATCHI